MKSAAIITTTGPACVARAQEGITLNLAKCKKRTTKKIRKSIKQQLQYVRRDFGYVEALLSDGVELSPKQLRRYAVLKQVYEKQQYLYEYQIHTVSDRIVSIS